MGIETMADNRRLDRLRAALGSGIAVVAHDTRKEGKVLVLEPMGAGDALQALAKRLRGWGLSVGAAREERHRPEFHAHVAVADALRELLQATKDPYFSLQYFLAVATPERWEDLQVSASGAMLARDYGARGYVEGWFAHGVTLLLLAAADDPRARPLRELERPGHARDFVADLLRADSVADVEAVVADLPHVDQPIRFLAERGESRPYERGRRTPLEHALERDRPDWMDALRAMGAGPSRFCHRVGATLVEAATAYRAHRCVRHLVDAGLDDEDLTVDLLAEASAQRYEWLVHLLVERGVPVNTEDREGSTPLRRAVLSHRGFDIGVVSMLVERGADPNARCRGTSLLSEWLAGPAPHFGTQALLRHGAAPDAEEATALLFRAVVADDDPMVERALARGADPTRATV